jgi:hypothetical protein
MHNIRHNDPDRAPTDERRDLIAVNTQKVGIGGTKGGAILRTARDI